MTIGGKKKVLWCVSLQRDFCVRGTPEAAERAGRSKEGSWERVRQKPFTVPTFWGLFLLFQCIIAGFSFFFNNPVVFQSSLAVDLANQCPSAVQNVCRLPDFCFHPVKLDLNFLWRLELWEFKGLKHKKTSVILLLNVYAAINEGTRYLHISLTFIKFIWRRFLCVHLWLIRDEDPEKQSKTEEDSTVAAATTQAAPTPPHVPITTPPPVMSTDVSAQTGYGAYSSWYQVGQKRSHVWFVIVTKTKKWKKICSDLKQPHYGGYGYQNSWNYNQGYYPPSWRTDRALWAHIKLSSIIIVFLISCPVTGFMKKSPVLMGEWKKEESQACVLSGIIKTPLLVS